MPSITTPQQLKNEILSRLGSPINTIEVTEDQVYRCIDRAVELYIDYHCDGVNKWVGICILTAEEAASGVLHFRNQPITAVTNVSKLAGDLGTAWWEGAVYDAFWHMSQDIVQHMRTFSGAGGMYMLELESFHQYRELQKTFFAPDPDFHYNSASRQLKIYDNALYEDQIILVESYVAAAANIDKTLLNSGQELLTEGCSLPGYDDQASCELAGGYWGPAYQRFENAWQYTGVVNSLTPSVEPTYFPQEAYNSRWLKDMATALVMQQWGWNLFKFKDQTLPGGVTVNSDAILEKAEAKIEKLLEEVKQIEAPCEFWLG